MSDTGLPERSGAAPTEDAPQYTVTGLNETLRIDGFSYIYDPELGLWEGEPGDRLTASEIHDMILEGRHRVFPWTPEAVSE